MAALRKGSFCKKVYHSFTTYCRATNEVITRTPLSFYQRQQQLSLFGRKHDKLTTETLSQSVTSDTQSDAVTTEADENDVDEYRERFIPITRRTIIRHLMQEEKFLNVSEKKIFEDFALHFDSAVVNRYHGKLQELKVLFDPINPDKDTIAGKKLNKKEALDNEFWLLQGLEHVMERANFNELQKKTVENALKEHYAREGVMVEVNPDKYDVLRFWVLGRETPEQKLPFYKRAFYRVSARAIPKPIEYYKRVVVAVRLKTDKKLMLKAFKEVPSGALEMLLPDGKIKISKFDKGILTTSISIGLIGIVAKLVTYLAAYKIQWTLVLTGVTALTAIQAWYAYNNKKNRYLVDLTRMLYFKNIANNRGLLALLVDRAEDEMFKEALLCYTMLLCHRAPSVQDMPSSEQLPAELGGISKTKLEQKIEDWVQKKSGTGIEFESSEAIQMLESLGLLQKVNDSLHVLPLDGTVRNLPIMPQTLSARTEEADIVEGYDRDYFQETEEEYKEEERKMNKFKIGWF